MRSAYLSKKNTVTELKKIKAELVDYYDRTNHASISKKSIQKFFSDPSLFHLKNQAALLLIDFLAIKIHEVNITKSLSTGISTDDDKIRAILVSDAYFCDVKKRIENTLQEFLPLKKGASRVSRLSDFHYDEKQDIEMESRFEIKQ